MPSWKELKRFCEHDGWDLVKDTDHYFYIKTDEYGKQKFTKVSKGSGEIEKTLWSRILKQQLQVFNSKI